MRNQFGYYVLVFIAKVRFSDIGKHIEDEERSIILRRAMHSGRAFDFENYHTYSEVIISVAPSAVYLNASAIQKKKKEKEKKHFSAHFRLRPL